MCEMFFFYIIGQTLHASIDYIFLSASVDAWWAILKIDTRARPRLLFLILQFHYYYYLYYHILFTSQYELYCQLDNAQVSEI